MSAPPLLSDIFAEMGNGVEDGETFAALLEAGS